MNRTFINIIISVFFLFTYSLPVCAQNNLNTSLIGRWANGPCYAADVQGNYLYFGNGASLEIADIFDFSNPVRLGKILLPGLVKNIKVDEKYAYVTGTDFGLHIIDISDPNEPELMSETNIGLFSTELLIKDDYLFFANDYRGINIVNISNPNSPNETSTIDVTNSAKDIHFSNSDLFITSTRGLEIYDISDLSNPKLISKTHFEKIAYAQRYTYHMAVQDSIVYLAGTAYGSHIMNVKDPVNPIEIGYIELFSVFHLLFYIFYRNNGDHFGSQSV